MIIVTGAAGFIGSNIIKGLNAAGHKDIIAVDELFEGEKFVNLVNCDIADYQDKDEFIASFIHDDKLPYPIEAVFHQGACSDTTEWDGAYMMDNNYTYSKLLLQSCLKNEVPFIYASSAAVYGGGKKFIEDRKNEKPINVYGYSKFLFDQYVRRILPQAQSQIVGLRYFNVYGPHEQHKGGMASVAYHHHQQLLTGDTVKLFEGCDGYGNGEQQRDFVYVKDIVNMNIWFLENRDKSGIFNAGTGKSATFNDVAKAVIAHHGRGKIEYIPFPEKLKGHYQSFTEADMSALRAIGYDKAFKTVAEGVKDYLAEIEIDK